MTNQQAWYNVKQGKSIPYKKETLAKIRELIEQKPCEDAISRQAVLSDKYIVYDMADNKDKEVVDVEFIKSLPPVQPKAKWIPVSERLPKSHGTYLVSRYFENVILTDACYFDGGHIWHNDNRINHGRDYVTDKIVAWMPLPEPYVPQESEGKG